MMINTLEEMRFMTGSIELDPDDEWQITGRTIDMGITEVKGLPEYFGIDLLKYPDTYFTSVAVIDPYNKEVLRIVNYVGGTDEFDGKEKTITISDPELRKSLYETLKQNSPADLSAELDKNCLEAIEFFAEEDEDLMNY